MQEFIDFLGRHSPYDRLVATDLEQLGRRVKVAYFGAGQVIVAPDSRPPDGLAVVRTGVVQVLDRSRVVDELGPGDTLAPYSTPSLQAPSLTVRAATDTLLYLLPDPQAVLEHPETLRLDRTERTFAQRALITNTAVDSTLRPVIDFMAPPLWCDSRVTIREAARVMTQERGSCVLIRLGRDLGIMTDSDCRKHVANAKASNHAPLSSIASVPALTIRADATAATAFIAMVHHGVHHLVVVDGERVLGVCRAIDLAAAEIRDPLTIRASIDAATTPEELAHAAGQLRPTCIELFDAGVPPLRIAGLHSAMIDGILAKVVAWTAPFDQAGDRFAWVVLGSVARREPLPDSDVDTGLLWTGDADQDDADLLRKAADAVLDRLERCGLERCPDGANASNPLFGRHYDEWVRRATRWHERPDTEGALLLGAMLADSRPVTGLNLGRRLADTVTSLPGDEDFVRGTLVEALRRRPPLGFVKDFIVDHDGEHRGQLNLKRGGLTPITALGRWIALQTRAPISSTQDRLALGVKAGLLTEDEGAQLRLAHQEIFEMLYMSQVEALREGARASTWLDPTQIDSLRRRHLRQSFKAIHEVQNRLERERLRR